MDLSPDQRRVFDSVLDWLANPRDRLLTCGGFAGSGKSTLLGELAKHFPKPVAYIATTGRAASVLANKLAAAGARPTTLMRPPDGKPLRRAYRHLFDPSLPENGGPPLCSTLHRLMFKPIIDSKTEELLGWTARDVLDRKYKLIVMDEASSVSDDMFRTIKTHGIPVLAVGDHGQLGPVRASGELMKNPMLRLEQIHRQAEGSSIIALSRHVREGGKLVDFRSWDTSCVLRKRSDIEAVVRETLAEPNQLDVALIAWMNRTRVELNRTARKIQGYDGQPPFPGETIIALHNYGAICNGMRGLLAKPSFMDERRNWILHANVEFPDDGMAGEWHEMNGHQFNRERTFASIDELRQYGIPAETMGGGGRLFDFGSCLTAHKAIGSQFSHTVVVVDRSEKPSEEDWRRWIYSSITRASSRLSVVV